MKKSFYPMDVLRPIKAFLEDREKKLNSQKKKLQKEDPFSDSDRLKENAAIDAAAEQKYGHARLEAVSTELEKMLITVRKALTKIKLGKYGLCDSCGKMIDTDRLAIDPSAQYCVSCANNKGYATREKVVG